MISRAVLSVLLGSVLCSQAAVIFPTESTWRLFRGTNEASFPNTLDWTGATNRFDDSHFTPALAPFWYGDIRAGGTQLTDMQNRYSCVFLRKAFVMTNTVNISALRLNYLVDDGLVVWVNGREIWRENLPTTEQLTTNTLAAPKLFDPAAFTNITITIPSGILLDGSNVLAVQVFNHALDDPDFGFDLGLDAFEAETIPPTITNIDPPRGVRSSLTGVTVTFSEPVIGVTADDLLIDTQPARSVTGTGDGTTYTFTFDQPPYGAVYLNWFPDHGIFDLALPPNAFDDTLPGATWNYELNDTVPPILTTLFPTAGATLRSLSQVEISFSEEVTGVDASDLLINNQPASSVQRIPGGPYVFKFAAASAGAVNLRWADGHAITDQAVPGNAFAGSTWAYNVDPNATLGQIVINEILASNIDDLRDEEGDAESWLELYNRGNSTVDLSGWSLSDNADVPGLWVFPARTLAPGQYLVIFASGKDRKTPTGANKMHTNFRLGRQEFVGLFNSDSPRVSISSFGEEYPPQRNDYSYGYETGGQLRYFSTPTPGAANGVSSINGVTEPVHYSTARGLFTQPFVLNLTCATPGAQIRYTVNGSEPTLLNGLLYAGPITVTNTLLVRAAGFRSGLLPSLVNTHTYLFNQSPAVRSLPILSIVTAVSNLYGRSGILGMAGGSRSSDGAFITNNPATDYHNPSAHGIAWERPVSAELIQPVDNSGFQIDCGIRVQGSDWQRPRTMPNTKFSYRLYFRGDYGAGKLNYPLFPHTSLQSFDQVVLRAGYNENGNPFIRDEMGRRLFSDMGNVSSQGTMVQLFTNGVYAGFYNPCERVNEAFGQAHHGGSAEWDVVGPNFAISSEGLGVVDGDRNDFNNLHSYISGQSASSIQTPAVYNEIARRLDLVNFVDYCLINVYGAMGDWPGNNWRAGKDRGPGGIWRFYVWDAEWGLGYNGRGFIRDSFAESGGGPTDSGLASSGNSEIARMYQALRRTREFRLLWADRIQKHFFNGGALTQLAVTNRLVELRTNLSGVFSMNMSELGPFLANRRTNIIDDFERYGLYGHSNSLYGVFASSNAPAFNQFGGTVPPGFALTMTAARGGTIYYTTDGADPRVRFTGAVSNSAKAYVGPVVLNQSGAIRARTLLNETNWSALVEASFSVGTAGVPLRLTEIMFNPTGGSIYEFIELQNIGGASVDLSGMYFSEGIEFTFNAGTRLAPGTRLVLANNADPAAFVIRYPGLSVAGYFQGNLNNAGERVTLRDAAGRLVTSVNYNDTSGWPTGTDGSGYSLEVSDPLRDPDDPANWRASTALNGSPGDAGTVPPAPAMRLNEALALNVSSVANGNTRPDFVELYNSGATPVNLSGWSLSDDGTPGEFHLPGGVTIAAGGYLVLWCDSATNNTPGLHTGFELDPDGDGLFLYDASSNRVDGLTFGRQAPDLSLGKIGGDWQLNVPTPGAPNQIVATAPASTLALNEWMANPAAGQSDWIELYNTSADLPVSLYGIYVGTTSAVHRLAAYSFLPPGGFLQLFADEGNGSTHLSFRLPAAGATLVLLDPSAVEIQRVSYAIQTEGISQGRLPDGTATVVPFPGSASPGLANYVSTYTGPVLNEVLARNVQSVTNAGRVADYVELYNPGAGAASLAGMSLSVGEPEAGQFTFPAEASIAANGYLVIWCDGGRPLSTSPGDYNVGRALDGETGGIYLFNNGGQIVNSVEYGSQVQDLSVGLSSGQWRLLSAPTPGQANAVEAVLGTASSLRINEWLASPVSGPDWVELYNTNSQPVDLGRLLLTDDLSTMGTNQFRIAPLSFIAGGGYVRWIADGDSSQGRNHLTFSLDAEGEGLRLYAQNGFTNLDTVVFSTQALGESQGRLPDGAATITRFPGSASPAGPNYVLIPSLVINEVLTHSASPADNAVELRNAGSNLLNLGGWYLSNSQDNPKKYRIQDGTSLAAGAYLVFTQSQFGGGPNGFALDAAHGDEVWVSAADANGNLTGARVGARVGAALTGVSFGRFPTTLGVDYPALSARSLGQANGTPEVGPVVINEIHYNPPAGPGAEEDEYVELLNVTAAPVNLFHAIVAANTWKISGGIEFSIPPTVTLPAGGFALLVRFNPDDPVALGAFRSRQGVPASVPVFGPFLGSLDNAGDLVELRRPDAPRPAGTPDAGYVPYVVVDRVDYGDAAPWPSGAVDGGGLSLQRKTPTAYGNEPLNWVAAVRSAGAANHAGVAVPPVVVTQPTGQTVHEGTSPVLTVAATGVGPLNYQWRRNQIAVPDATNSSYALTYAISADTGIYDVIVSNPGGSTLSSQADLRIVVPPIILSAPANLLSRVTTTATLVVVARGDAPLTYQWRKDGVDLPGENAPSLVRTNVQLADEGLYEVVLVNAVGQASASATLQVLINPAMVQNPISQSVVVGSLVTLSASYTGNPKPFTNEWRKISPLPIFTNTHVIQATQDFFTFTASSVPQTNVFRLVVRNQANPLGVGSSTVTIVTLADTDGDGLPDAWESRYGLSDRNADTDGDGMSNWREFIAGTDPTDRLSYLRVDLSAGEGNATVQFNAVSNNTYTVQYSDTMPATWRRLSDVVARPESRVEFLPDPAWTTNRFYRLLTPWQIP